MQTNPAQAVSTALAVANDRTDAAAKALRRNIRRNPLRHVGVATVVGVIAGVAAMALLKRR